MLASQVRHAIALILDGWLWVYWLLPFQLVNERWFATATLPSLLVFLVLRHVLKQVWTTPGRYALGIDLHNRIDERIKRNECFHSVGFALFFLFLAGELLTRSVSPGLSSVQFWLLIAGGYWLSTLSILLFRLSYFGYWGVVATLLLFPMIWLFNASARAGINEFFLDRIAVIDQSVIGSRLPFSAALIVLLLAGSMFVLFLLSDASRYHSKPPRQKRVKDNMHQTRSVKVSLDPKLD